MIMMYIYLFKTSIPKVGSWKGKYHFPNGVTESFQHFEISQNSYFYKVVAARRLYLGNWPSLKERVCRRLDMMFFALNKRCADASSHKHLFSRSMFTLAMFHFVITLYGGLCSMDWADPISLFVYLAFVFYLPESRQSHKLCWAFITMSMMFH